MIPQALAVSSEVLCRALTTTWVRSPVVVYFFQLDSATVAQCASGSESSINAYVYARVNVTVMKPWGDRVQPQEKQRSRAGPT